MHITYNNIIWGVLNLPRKITLRVQSFTTLMPNPHQDMNLATFFLEMCSFLEDFEILKLRREEY